MTIELLGVHALIVFIMVMTTFYAYVIIIHTVTSHKHCVQDSVVVCCFFTYESQLSVPPVAETESFGDTLP